MAFHAAPLPTAPEVPRVAPQPILEVENLCVEVAAGGGTLRAVDGVGFQVPENGTVGLVGESGSGKSLTAFSILNLPPRGASIRSGRILFRGRDLLAMPPGELRRLRGKEIALIFQEPGAALNPVLTVETQLTEGMRAHLGISRAEARRRALTLLEQVRVSDPSSRLRQYPHQLSGGIQQRLMIAMALACEPSLLVADEPTTALDVTIQADILQLLADVRKRYRLAMLLISHDLGVVAQNCDWVAVMYAGRLVEFASCAALFAAPQHPYTQALLRATPRLDRPVQRLETIPGGVPALHAIPRGCAFHPRCGEAVEQCLAAVPELRPVGDHHWVRCVRRPQPETGA